MSSSNPHVNIVQAAWLSSSNPPYHFQGARMSFFSPNNNYTFSSTPAQMGWCPPNQLFGAPVGSANSNGLKTDMDKMREKLNYLSGFVDIFKGQIHTDILVKPGNNGPSIPAHRAHLAARSVVFEHMLDSDSCKAPLPNDYTIRLPELSYEELDSLLEFLYSGELPIEKLRNHVYALLIAADKYEIPFLQKYCLDFIDENFEDDISTDTYEAFALKSPHLALKITRDFVAKKRKRLN